MITGLKSINMFQAFKTHTTKSNLRKITTLLTIPQVMYE